MRNGKHDRSVVWRCMRMATRFFGILRIPPTKIYQGDKLGKMFHIPYVSQTPGTGLQHPSFNHWFTTSFLQPLVYDILPSTTGLRYPPFNHWFTTYSPQPLVYDIFPSTTGLRHPPFNHWFTTSFLQPLVYDILPSTTGLRHPSFNHCRI